MDGVLTALPRRPGPRPRTRRRLPHAQLDQQPTTTALHHELARRCFALPGVREEPSGISVPGARALVLDPPGGAGRGAAAFLVGAEFAHLHPGPDLSLHVTLPEPLADAAIAAGWAEHHVLVADGLVPPTVVMVYAPRDDAELDVVWALVEASHRFARSGAGLHCTHG